MPHGYQAWPLNHVEALMEISATLADHTATMELAQQIPAYLAEALERDAITLAVIRTGEPASSRSNTPRIPDEPRVVLRGYSAAVAAELGTGEEFTAQLLEIHRQTRPLTSREAPVLRADIAVGPAAEAPFAEMPVPNFGEFSRAIVFARSIDASHRMLLIVHERPEQASTAAAGPLTESLLAIANQLAKLLRCLFAWENGPTILGGDFERLTEREWFVLHGLNSDAGEKQLADQLDLSPHTLHSHIKSIYRKVGVQGRLPLLTRLQQAMRDLRTATVNTRVHDLQKTEAAAVSPPPAVAIG